jgi:hypothetical protein
MPLPTSKESALERYQWHVEQAKLLQQTCNLKTDESVPSAAAVALTQEPRIIGSVSILFFQSVRRRNLVCSSETLEDLAVRLLCEHPLLIRHDDQEENTCTTLQCGKTHCILISNNNDNTLNKTRSLSVRASNDIPDCFLDTSMLLSEVLQQFGPNARLEFDLDDEFIGSVGNKTVMYHSVYVPKRKSKPFVPKVAHVKGLTAPAAATTHDEIQPSVIREKVPDAQSVNQRTTVSTNDIVSESVNDNVTVSTNEIDFSVATPLRSTLRTQSVKCDTTIPSIAARLAAPTTATLVPASEPPTQDSFFNDSKHGQGLEFLQQVETDLELSHKSSEQKKRRAERSLTRETKRNMLDTTLQQQGSNAAAKTLGNAVAVSGSNSNQSTTVSNTTTTSNNVWVPKPSNDSNLGTTKHGQAIGPLNGFMDSGICDNNSKNDSDELIVDVDKQRADDCATTPNAIAVVPSPQQVSHFSRTTLADAELRSRSSSSSSSSSSDSSSTSSSSDSSSASDDDIPTDLIARHNLTDTVAKNPSSSSGKHLSLSDAGSVSTNEVERQDFLPKVSQSPVLLTKVGADHRSSSSSSSSSSSDSSSTSSSDSSSTSSSDSSSDEEDDVPSEPIARRFITDGLAKNVALNSVNDVNLSSANRVERQDLIQDKTALGHDGEEQETETVKDGMVKAVIALATAAKVRGVHQKATASAGTSTSNDSDNVSHESHQQVSNEESDRENTKQAAQQTHLTVPEESTNQSELKSLTTSSSSDSDSSSDDSDDDESCQKRENSLLVPINVVKRSPTESNTMIESQQKESDTLTGGATSSSESDPDSSTSSNSENTSVSLSVNDAKDEISRPIPLEIVAAPACGSRDARQLDPVLEKTDAIQWQQAHTVSLSKDVRINGKVDGDASPSGCSTSRKSDSSSSSSSSSSDDSSTSSDSSSDTHHNCETARAYAVRNAESPRQQRPVHRVVQTEPKPQPSRRRKPLLAPNRKIVINPRGDEWRQSL